MDIIQQIKDTVNIAEYISRYIKLEKKGDVFVGHCPFHKDDTPSFTVFPDTKSFFCFGCQAGLRSSVTNGSDIISFVSAIENIPISEAIKKLATEYNIKYDDKTAMLINNNLDLSRKFYVNLYSNEHALSYLYNRGLNDDDITKWRIGFGFDSYFPNRIVFPILDISYNTLGFVARSISDDTPKYINSKNSDIFDKSSLLYGINNAYQSIKDNDEVIIVEGVFDCIKMHKVGFTNTVATMTNIISENQINKLKSITENFTVIYDGDKEGISGAIRSCKRLLNHGIIPKICILPDQMDPDEFISSNNIEYVKEYIKDNSIDFVLYLIKTHVDRLNNRVADAIRDFITSCGKIKKDLNNEHVIEYFDMIVDSIINKADRSGRL